MSSPAIAFILLKPIVAPDVFRKAYGFKYAHILAGGKDICTIDLRIDMQNAAGHIFAFVKLEIFHAPIQRAQEITHADRFLCDCRELSGRDLLAGCKTELLFEKGFACILRLRMIIENMESIVIFVLRIDAISSKAAAQTVGTVMHGRHGMDDALSIDRFSAF